MNRYGRNYICNAALSEDKYIKKRKKMSVLKKNKKKNLVNPFGRKPKEITPNAIVLAYRSYSWQRSVL